MIQPTEYPQYAAGERVQLAPHLDRWMMGDRYGAIVSKSRGGRFYRVKLDKSGKVLRLIHTNFEPIN